MTLIETPVAGAPPSPSRDQLSAVPPPPAAADITPGGPAKLNSSRGSSPGHPNFGYQQRPNLGPRCRHCRHTEARCAYTAGCCPDCTHWGNWTPAGEPIPKQKGPQPKAGLRRAS